jgi:hypothetical protein
MRYFLPCVIAGIIAACSYGNYDGSGFDAGADGGGTDGGAVVLSQAVDPAKDEVLLTPDSVLELTFAKGTFAATTTITVKSLPDRTIDGLIVPVYEVSAPSAPTKPFQVVLHGNNPNPGGGNNRLLLVAQQETGGGAFAPLPIASSGLGGGPSNSVWGIAKTLGTFSLVFETVTPTNAFFDPSSASCIGKCCQANGAGGFNANAVPTSTGIACQGGPNLSCFLGACPDLDAFVARVNDLSKNNPPTPVNCRPFAALDGGSNCPGPGCNGYQGNCQSNNVPCCVQGAGGMCGGGTGTICDGMAIRCDLDTKCPNGTTCCVFDHDAYCTATCPDNRKVCKVDADCAGIGCQAAPKCPFGTCGTPPDTCK